MAIRKAVVVCLVAVLMTFASLAVSEGAPYDMPNTAYDLSGKIGIDQSRFHVHDMVYDFERNDVYFSTWETGGCGLFLLMRYNIDEDTIDNNLNNGSARCQSYPNVWNIMSVTLDYDTDTIFGGARGSWWGGFQAYTIDDGVYHKSITPNLTPAMMSRTAYDPDGGDVYGASSSWDGAGGDLIRYHVANGATTNLTYKLSALWGAKQRGYTDLYAIDYDSANKVVYVGGVRGKLARYNTPLYTYGTNPDYPMVDTAYQIDLSSTSWGLNQVSSILYVPSLQAIYIGGSNGKFGVLTEDGAGNINVTELSAAVSSVVGSGTILDFAFGNGQLFIGATGGTFLKYDVATGEATDLSDTIASFWGGYSVNTLAYDYNNDVVYLGGSYGRLARFNPVVVVPATVDVDPNTLNRKSRSSNNAVTVYIEVPDYDITMVDLDSITLSTANGSVTAQVSPYEVGDYDGDGIADLMVKFDRQDVIGIVDAGDNVEVTVTGDLDNVKFSGSDSIRVIH